MAKKYKIILEPHPILHQKAAAVEKVDQEIQTLFKDMLEIMYQSNGAGLAAPQIGISKRLLTIDVRHAQPDTPVLCMANPEIIWSSDDKKTEKEYCLSVPEIGVSVTRPAEVKVRYIDEHTQTQEIHATGLLSYCFQHELDHLNGITTLHYLSPIKRQMALQKLKRIKRQIESKQHNKEGHAP